MKRSVLFILFALACTIAIAQEVPLRQAQYLDWRGKQISTSDNCSVIVWRDTVLGNMDIFAQKIDSAGTLLWPEPLLITGNPGEEYLFDLVQSSDNNYIIAWFEADTNGNYSLGVQKISPSGTKLWGESGTLLPATGYAQAYAKILPNDLGGVQLIFVQYGTPRTIIGYSLDANAASVWQESGLQLFSNEQNIVLDDAISDGEGGIILNIRKYTEENTGYSHLMHISAAGNIIGSNPMLSESPFTGAIFNIRRIDTGAYLLYQVVSYNGCSISFQKMDNQGNLLLPSAVQYSLAPTGIVEGITIEAASDSDIILSWESTPDFAESYLMAQRFNAALAPMWQTGGIEVLSSTSSLAGSHSSVVSASGISWYIMGSKVQSLDIWGNRAFATGGLSFSNSETFWAVSTVFTDRATLIWMQESNQQMSIRRQVIMNNGYLLLTENSSPVVSRLSGITGANEIFALGDKYLALWADSRDGYYNDCTYYQLCDQSMQPLLEPNGRELFQGETPMESFISAKLITDNTLAVLYSFYEDGGIQLHVQVIDSNGECLYPGGGIDIPIGGNNARNLAMSTWDGAIYLGWSETGDAETLQIKGQCIANGKLLWGNNGRIIHTVAAGNTTNFIGLEGRYYLWEEMGQSKTLLVDELGNPQAGWNPAGINLLTGDVIPRRRVISQGIVDGNLIIFHSVFNNEPSCLRIQKVSPTAQLLWTPEGVTYFVPMTGGVNVDVCYGNDLSFIVQSGYGPVYLYLQKISADGNLLCGTDGVLIADNLNTSPAAKLLQYENGTYTCLWMNTSSGWSYASDIHYRHFSAAGIPLGTSPSVLCHELHKQENIKVAVMGNQSGIIWNDDRVGEFDPDYAYTSIYGYPMFAPVAVDDPTANSPVLPFLQPNYPNPFNPSTTISYFLPEAARLSLSIYNLKGQLVNTLLADALVPSGTHNIQWNGNDRAGKSVGSGIYYCRLTVGNKHNTRKMVLAK